MGASSRRDQRRRLVASWTRSSGEQPVDEAQGSRSASPATPYEEAADPARHPALATRLPTGLGGLLVAAGLILVPMAAAIALAVSGPLLGRPLLPVAEGRFARSLAVVGDAFDHQTGLPVQFWLAELSLLSAAAVAGAVRYMRRHRRDDFKGRFRAWGWLAVCFTVAAWAGAIPLGPLVAAVASDATGIVIGPAGIGWWLGLAAGMFALISPWAVLPLRERAATAFWMVLGLAAWAAAAAMPWAGEWVGGDARAAIIGQAAWAAGAALLLVAMLAAARSVIREVRGLCGPAAEKAPRKTRAERRQEARAAAATSEAVAGDADEVDDQPEEELIFEEARADDSEPSGSEFVDGSEADDRHLSKAERKRLRKLARMNGHAA
ncbi:MAG: hypothetical protein RLZZ440_49 [Planctomycetota bacterium]